jgi:hypothetical protein
LISLSIFNVSSPKISAQSLTLFDFVLFVLDNL